MGGKGFSEAPAYGGEAFKEGGPVRGDILRQVARQILRVPALAVDFIEEPCELAPPGPEVEKVHFGKPRKIRSVFRLLPHGAVEDGRAVEGRGMAEEGASRLGEPGCEDVTDGHDSGEQARVAPLPQLVHDVVEGPCVRHNEQNVCEIVCEFVREEADEVGEEGTLPGEDEEWVHNDSVSSLSFCSQVPFYQFCVKLRKLMYIDTILSFSCFIREVALSTHVQQSFPSADRQLKSRP